MPLLGARTVGYDDIEIGSKIPILVIEISLVQMVMYCAITWDFARLHYDPQFVQKFGLTRPVVDPQMHGAFAARMLSDWISDSGRIRRLSLKYKAPCYLENTITYGGEVVNKSTEGDAKYIDCDLTAANEKGEQPIVGTASILFY